VSEKIVIGIDGGGTYTRVMAVGLSGRVLSYVESGGANPFHNPDAKENIQTALSQTISLAGVELADIACIVSGFAGLDGEGDHKWANEFTSIEGLSCKRIHVNDAVIAHAGAMRSRPGIIVILGTGSIIFAVNEEGRHIRNYDFHHYAASAARYLSYETVHRIIAGEYHRDDEGFIKNVLDYWKVASIESLCKIGMNGFTSSTHESNKQFGNMCPLVTDAAERGIPLARSICDAGAKKVEIGVRLVGECFRNEEVPVSLIGGVARSGYMLKAISRGLSRQAKRKYTLVKPAFSAVAGAALLGLELAGIAVNKQTEATLEDHPSAIYRD
jgi:glucosamine kinase